MKFGLVEDFRNPPQWQRPYPELYQDLLDQIAHVEDLGYDNIWLTEHHFTEDGYNPSLFPTAAAIAARTSRIRIGTFIVLLPFQHPVRVAEDATSVDIFSNGRFDLGVGQGYSYHEFNAFCMPRKERTARLTEGVQLIQQLWTEPPVTFDGKFTQVKDMTLSPMPVQQPHVPLWIGARTEKATRRVARLGCHLMATFGLDPAPWYVDELQKLGHNPADFNIAQLRTVYIADSEDQAWEDVQEYAFSMMEFYGDIVQEAKDVPGDENFWTPKKPQDLRDAAYGQSAMIGTVDQVARKLEQFCQDFHCTHFVMSTQLPGLATQKANRSLEIFAEEVMPHFREA